jgi:hypothetical protein
MVGGLESPAHAGKGFRRPQNNTMKGPHMQTPLEVEGLLAGPESLAAANEEYTRQPQPSPAGWDPFEVWRTRVKAAQEAPKSGAQIV